MKFKFKNKRKMKDHSENYLHSDEYEIKQGIKRIKLTNNLKNNDNANESNFLLNIFLSKIQILARINFFS